MSKPNNTVLKPDAEVVKQTAKLAKQLEEDLEEPDTEKVLLEIRQLQRSLNVLESELTEDEEGSIGEGC